MSHRQTSKDLEAVMMILKYSLGEDFDPVHSAYGWVPLSKNLKPHTYLDRWGIRHIKVSAPKQENLVEGYTPVKQVKYA